MPSESSLKKAREIMGIDIEYPETYVERIAAALDAAQALPDGAQHWKTCVDVNCTHWACKMGHDAVDAYRQLKAQALPGECDCEFGGGSFRQCDRCRALAPAPEQQDRMTPEEIAEEITLKLQGVHFCGGGDKTMVLESMIAAAIRAEREAREWPSEESIQGAMSATCPADIEPHQHQYSFYAAVDWLKARMQRGEK